MGKVLKIILGLIGIFIVGFLILVFVPFSSKDILKILRDDIVPSIVQIQCYDQFGEIVGVGTGSYSTAENEHLVETNAHVVLADDGEFYGCNVYFPYEDGSFYESVYWAGEIYLYHNQESIVNEFKVNGIDYAQLVLTQPVDDGNNYPFPPNKIGFFETLGITCQGEDEIKLGDKIYVLGYPAIGGESLTINEGIVSGFLGDFNEWIKVSANINPGNSGGVAIGADDGCMYGIPTQTISDETGSIGQLLTYSFISEFNEGLTEKEIEGLDFKNRWLKHEDKDSGFSTIYPEKWILTEDFEGVDAYFSSESENALDSFLENYNVLVEDFLEEGYSFQQYTDYNLLQLEGLIEGFEASESVNTKIDGIPAYKVSYFYYIGEIDLFTIQYWTVKDNKGVVITFISESDKQDFISDIANKAVKNFKFI